MSWVYPHCIRPLLFRQNPEAIHELTLTMLGHLGRVPLLSRSFRTCLRVPELPVTLFGLRFPNPIGLAAGMDKEAEAVPAWDALGFGFTELGAVTWHAQPGNPQPRVFRAIADEAIVNRMGFNNRGAQAFAAALDAWRALDLWPSHPVGVNLGKSKLTPLTQAADDYAASFRLLWGRLDFFVVNVSSPNTPNLRQLQDKSALDEILAALQEVNTSEAQRAGTIEARPKPVLVKVAPDLGFEALDDILSLVGPRGVAGLVATNTTITRPGDARADLARIYAEAGGLSGKPLRARSTEVIRHLHRQTRGQLPLIGVGGIFTPEDAWEKIEAGATLLQVYTGLVYEGPAMVGRLVRGLRDRLAQAGGKELADAVGRSAA